HLLSFPTRRSSDLLRHAAAAGVDRDRKRRRRRLATADRGAAAGGHRAAARRRAFAPWPGRAVGHRARHASGPASGPARRRRPRPPARPRDAQAMRAQRGAALILVMWMVALLAALIGAYAASARIEYMQGRGLHGAVVAESAARAGLEYALVRVQAH